ncbi:protein of unknown function DUF364 [Methanothermus fervidus DSM 2088]|uniref:Putative heavy-metal chelation domain-containing protein n=1 Tax=Methanothermus fervidus (strain ATCC 43054 / DSM 2088 / JCM 10308 / V24 S) TaxID=523846 RepID=E3GXL5_METFV|nr:DUF364 domain-containing protein [Methanothermus fervidus]ADP77047.1 protein of unknown function DUF364 [Methanothermus fervidus DSM 2088]
MKIKEKIKKYLKSFTKDLLDEEIEIKVANPNLDTKKIKDYPLVKGKEILLRANFKGNFGDCFTNSPTVFKGKIKDILKHENISCQIACLNAVMRYYGIIENTRHCTSNYPEKCAKKFVEYVKDNFSPEKVGIIGFQPAFVREFSNEFDKIFVTDLNPENVGSVKYGIKVLDAKYNPEIIKCCDVVLITGSTIANNTFNKIYEKCKKYKTNYIFYGTTIAGIAHLLKLDRFCPFSD